MHGRNLRRKKALSPSVDNNVLRQKIDARYATHQVHQLRSTGWATEPICGGSKSIEPADGIERRATMLGWEPESSWYRSKVNSTCEGLPRSVMMTGPCVAAFLALAMSWLNSRLDMVRMLTTDP